jgi:hypothetical protein
VLVLSVSLSFTMFSSIAPPDMPWFAWAALGLTDGGFLGWLIVFRMIKYHGAHKSVAFVMIWVCLAAVLFTDAMELARMFHIAPIFAGMYYYALIALLLGHFLALAIDELISESQKYEQQHGLSPAPQPTQRITEDRQPKDEQTFEQRATRSLPSPRGPGFLDKLRNAAAAFRLPGELEDIHPPKVPVSPPAQNVPDVAQLEDDEDASDWEKAQAAAAAKIACAGNCGKVGVQGNWLHARGDGNNWYCPECHAKKP